MKRDIMTIIIGLLFLLAGIAIGGSMLGIFDLRINLDGWWTVFIIVPALIAIAQGGFNVGNVIILGVGVILLLNAQGILPEGFSWKLIFPVALLGLGFQLLFGGRGNCCGDRSWHHHRDDGNDECSGGTGSGSTGSASGSADNRSDGSKNSGGGIFTEQSKAGASYKTASALFGAQDIYYGQEEFTGASYTAVFGGLTINMCNVILKGDVVINVSAIFGGIDLILPPNVQVISHVTPILGGTEIKYASSSDSSAHKVIVNGAASFGGIEIK